MSHQVRTTPHSKEKRPWGFLAPKKVMLSFRHFLTKVFGNLTDFCPKRAQNDILGRFEGKFIFGRGALRWAKNRSFLAVPLFSWGIGPLPPSFDSQVPPCCLYIEPQVVPRRLWGPTGPGQQVGMVDKPHFRSSNPLDSGFLLYFQSLALSKPRTQKAFYICCLIH